jgi:hypothetical protein
MGIGRDRTAQDGEPLGEADDGPRVEQLGVVTEHEGESFVVSPGLQHEIELGLPVAGVEELQRQIGEGLPAPTLPVLAVQDGHGLKERGAAQVALHLQLGQQLFERHVLVGHRLQNGRPGAVEEVGEGRVSRQISSQDERVGEVADDRLKLDAVSPGEGRADHDVVLPAVAGQKHLVGGQQHHEKSRAALLAHPLQLRGDTGRQPEGVKPSPVGENSRARVIERQLQHRRGGEPLTPVVERRRVVLAPLPERDIPVPHPQLRELRGGPVAMSGIEAGQVVSQHVERPAVARDVVKHDAQHVVVLGQPQQADAQRRRPGEVERSIRPLGDKAPGLLHPSRELFRDTLFPRGPLPGMAFPQRLLSRVLLPGEVDVLDHRSARRFDDHDRSALHVRIASPQSLVPRHQILEGAAQRLGVERAV